MQRILIITANWLLLVLLLLGLPAATRAQVGNLQLSSAATGRLLLLSGLGIALALNLLGALRLVKARQNRTLCWEWTALYTALLLATAAYFHGWFNFLWLRHTLQWLQRHL